MSFLTSWSHQINKLQVQLEAVSQKKNVRWRAIEKDASRLPLVSTGMCTYIQTSKHTNTHPHTHTHSKKNNIILEKVVRLILWKNFMCILKHSSENSVEISCKRRKYLPRGHSRNQLYIHVYMYSMSIFLLMIANTLHAKFFSFKFSVLLIPTLLFFFNRQ